MKQALVAEWLMKPASGDIWLPLLSKHDRRGSLSDDLSGDKVARVGVMCMKRSTYVGLREINKMHGILVKSEIHIDCI